MGNRVMARKVKTQDGYAVLIADNYAKTYVEFDHNPSPTEAWTAALNTEEFEDVLDDVYSSKGRILFNESGNPVSDRVFIFEDHTA